MTGLILKDIYTSIKELKSYFVILALFIGASFISQDFFFCAAYPCLICGMFPQSLLSFDERGKWDFYCGTLPVSKAAIVSAKYIFSLLIIALVMVVSSITHTAHILVTHTFGWDTYWMLLALLFSLSCLVVAVQLPFLFKYGTEKGRFAYWIMVLLASGGSASMVSVFDDQFLPTIPIESLLPFVCILCAALYALSWFFSIKFYQKREIS